MDSCADAGEIAIGVQIAGMRFALNRATDGEFCDVGTKNLFVEIIFVVIEEQYAATVNRVAFVASVVVEKRFPLVGFEGILVEGEAVGDGTRIENRAIREAGSRFLGLLRCS